MQIDLKTLKEQQVASKESSDANKVSNDPPHRQEYSTDEEELARETGWIRAKSRKKRKLNTSPTQSPQEENERNNENIKYKEKVKNSPKPPPIIVDGIINYQSFYDLVSQRLEKTQFTVKMSNGQSGKINATDGESYRTIIKLLNENKLLWHSYENKQERPIRVIAKKLHFTCEPARIIEDLKEQGFKIKDAANKISYRKKEPLNMFMLTFENEEDISKIYNIRSILGCKVEIHAIKSTKLVPQCKRCQAYGHTQGYCSKEPRCVKCTGKHLTKDCKKASEEKPKCIHCGGAHPASYRGCTVAKEMQAIKNRQQKKPTTSKAQRTAQEINYAMDKKSNDVVNSQLPPQKNTNIHTYAQIVSKGAASLKRNDTHNRDIYESKLDEILNRLVSFDERLRRLENSKHNAAFKPKK